MRKIILILLIVVTSSFQLKYENELFQKFLDHPSLQEYFHEMDAVQHQLYLINLNNLPKSLELTKFGKKVPVCSEKEIFENRISNFIGFDSINLSPEAAYMLAVYPLKRIKIEASYKLKNETWEVENYQIIKE